MSKLDQRKASAYDVGAKIGRKIARLHGKLGKKQFNKAYSARMQTGDRKPSFQCMQYAGAVNGYHNELKAIARREQLKSYQPTGASHEHV